MVVANNEIDATKNAGKLTTISMTMWMRQCHAGRITQCPMKHNQGFTRSHWMPPSGEFSHVLSGRPPWSTILVENTKH
jgi:hypothetical protein